MARANAMKILIVANDSLARAGLAALLVSNEEFTVVGQTDGHGDLLAQVEIYRPDLLVWDLGWDPDQAIELLGELRETGCPPIVALLPDAGYAAEAWSCGARGLLLRDTDPASLVAALGAAGQGLLVIDPELSLAIRSSERREATALAEGLTPREMEVLRLVAEGLSNKSIAQRLGITEHTVKFHVNAILGKLGAQSRTEAAAAATRLGLILL